MGAWIGETDRQRTLPACFCGFHASGDGDELREEATDRRVLSRDEGWVIKVTAEVTGHTYALVPPFTLLLSPLLTSCPGRKVLSMMGSPRIIASAIVPGPALVTMQSTAPIHSSMLDTKPCAPSFVHVCVCVCVGDETKPRVEEGLVKRLIFKETAYGLRSTGVYTYLVLQFGSR